MSSRTRGLPKRIEDELHDLLKRFEDQGLLVWGKDTTGKKRPILVEPDGKLETS